MLLYVLQAQDDAVLKQNKSFHRLKVIVPFLWTTYGLYAWSTCLLSESYLAMPVAAKGIPISLVVFLS